MDLHSISKPEAFTIEIDKPSPNFNNAPGDAPKLPEAFLEDS
jgi:hypothetical protein